MVRYSFYGHYIYLLCVSSLGEYVSLSQSFCSWLRLLDARLGSTETPLLLDGVPIALESGEQSALADRPPTTARAILPYGRSGSPRSASSSSSSAAPMPSKAMTDPSMRYCLSQRGIGVDLVKGVLMQKVLADGSRGLQRQPVLWARGRPGRPGGRFPPAPPPPAGAAWLRSRSTVPAGAHLLGEEIGQAVQIQRVAVSQLIAGKWRL